MRDNGTESELRCIDDLAPRVCLLIVMLLVHLCTHAGGAAVNDPVPATLLQRIDVPRELLVPRAPGGEPCLGDLRIGDLTGDGRMDFVVFGAIGGLKPSFIAAFAWDGELLWTYGDRERTANDKASDDTQHTIAPLRPGPVTVYDFDGDGACEVLCLALREDVDVTDVWRTEDVELLLLDGRSGAVKQRAAPPELLACSVEVDGERHESNYCHQRFMIANFRGGYAARDFAIKLGDRILAFDDALNVLWTYQSRWSRYPDHAAYIPAVGDADGDGRDEVNGGHFLLDDDGTPMWEQFRGTNNDSVLIEEWDGDETNGAEAIMSGYGQVVNARGEVLLKVGERQVPHGQEIRMDDFRPDVPGNELIIRYAGHKNQLMVVSRAGEILTRFEVDPSPNETGIETIHWHRPDAPPLLYAPAALYDGHGRKVVSFPDLPPPTGGKMGWYHCVPVQVSNAGAEGVLVYDPCATSAYLYGPEPISAPLRYRHTARQYNMRLMD